MSTTITYPCGTAQRHKKVLDSPLNGIDYLEVALPASTTEPAKLMIHFLKPLGERELTKDKLEIVNTADALPVRVQEITEQKDELLTFTLDTVGDLSIYTLCLRDHSEPLLFDPRLAEVAFTFRTDPPANLGAQPPLVRPPTEPEINYLAKDYASFRRLMLDRLAVLQPGGVDDQPADLQVALVELLAYTADHLSYYQDAVATEAYLGTARSRISLRRHARLLDYRVHEGCNARVWVHCTVGSTVPVQNEWFFSTTDATPIIFEPCHTPKLYPQNSLIPLYTWGEVDFVLPAGTTEATLMQKEPALKLQAGDFLLLRSTAEPLDPTLRHVVRLTSVVEGIDPVEKDKSGKALPIVEVAWAAEDALPFELPIRQQGIETAVAHGNLVLADQGQSFRNEPLPANATRMDTPTALRLPRGPVTRAEPLPADLNPEKPDQQKLTRNLTPAAHLFQRKVPAALPVVTVAGDGVEWKAVYDLLASAADDAVFVVESEHDGSATLRFGDGSFYGRQPSQTATFTVDYRIGNGQAGNVGADAIVRVTGTGTDGIQVTNPLPASGGEDPESAERVRLFAPQAFRRQERGITADDYAARAQTFSGVQKAAASIRWTGSWYTVYLFVDREAGRPVDDAFKRQLLDHLAPYRLAGYDLEIRGPTFVSLAITLTFTVKPGFAPNAVQAALADAFSVRELANQRRGFFHPDNWTFGQPVYLSKLYQVALAVLGVATVDASKFYRFGQPETTSRVHGVIAIGPHEIAGLGVDKGAFTQVGLNVGEAYGHRIA